MSERDRPLWMTSMDQRILELLARTRHAKMGGLWLQPKGIAINLDASRPYVSERLSELVHYEYVERSDDGMYRITEKGMEFVMQ